MAQLTAEVLRSQALHVDEERAGALQPSPVRAVLGRKSRHQKRVSGAVFRTVSVHCPRRELKRMGFVCRGRQDQSSKTRDTTVTILNIRRHMGVRFK